MKCPGQDTQFWRKDSVFEIKCPSCGNSIEFFKDDVSRTCKACGQKVLNPKMDFGCATYCKYAKQCLGGLPPELIAQRQELLKDRVATEMKRYFGNDFKKIAHTTRVARYAERIGKEEGADMATVMAAAYLLLLGSSIARKILEKLGAKKELIDEVCDMISHRHHPRKQETLNFKVLYDADLITQLEEKHKKEPIPKEDLERIIEKDLFTASAKRLAKEIFLEKDM